jgi:polar amino acid transport system substrate-binding protein
MWTRREAIAVAITTLTTGWKARAQAQATSAAARLCPTGKLRAALIASNPVLVTRRSDGTLGGVSVAVAHALAAHLSVPIELKPYDNPARYNESLATDDWDIGLAARDPARADHLAFSATFMEVDNGYVARPGAPPTSAEEVDRPGIKIAVAQGSAPHTVLRATGNADVYGENLHLAHRIADADQPPLSGPGEKLVKGWPLRQRGRRSWSA